ncbi:hypothetical protein SARC_03026, partial [Sphaeroforma arctica JP610]
FYDETTSDISTSSTHPINIPVLYSYLYISCTSCFKRYLKFCTTFRCLRPGLQAQGIPVIVCCETYKFWAARVQTDCFVYNELDIPTDLIPPPNRTDDAAPSPLDKDDLPTNIGMINIVYDVTPPEFIDMIITEIGMIPCSSIPVILREYDVYKKEGAAVV